MFLNTYSGYFKWILSNLITAVYASCENQAVNAVQFLCGFLVIDFVLYILEDQVSEQELQLLHTKCTNYHIFGFDVTHISFAFFLDQLYSADFPFTYLVYIPPDCWILVYDKAVVVYCILSILNVSLLNKQMKYLLP